MSAIHDKALLPTLVDLIRRYALRAPLLIAVDGLVGYAAAFRFRPGLGPQALLCDQPSSQTIRQAARRGVVLRTN